MYFSGIYLSIVSAINACSFNIENYIHQLLVFASNKYLINQLSSLILYSRVIIPYISLNMRNFSNNFNKYDLHIK